MAGLTIAREIARAGRSVVVVERGERVGGLARTFRREGFSFDLGGHRFHSNNPDVVNWLKQLMGGDLLRVDRRSRIHLRGRFIDYPIRLTQATRAFGAAQAVRGGLSYLGALATNHRQAAVTFEDWVTRRFGRVLYEIYFKPYTEKVWGIRCDQLSADWAAQRISVPNLAETVRSALFPPRIPPPTAVRQFYYPRLGYGTISDRLADAITAHGQQVLTSTSLATLRFGRGDTAVDVVDAAGAARTITCGQVVSTVPLDALLGALAHEPGIAEVAADTRLAYRGIVLVFLGIAKPRVSPDSWTYFPSPDLLFGRSHEPKNWSAAMVPARPRHVAGARGVLFAGRADLGRRRRGARRARGRRTRRRRMDPARRRDALVGAARARTRTRCRTWVTRSASRRSAARWPVIRRCGWSGAREPSPT